MRVLLVVPTASMKFGGEAILPVHWFRTLRALDVDVDLLTHDRTSAELPELFPADTERIHFVRDTFLHRCLDAPSRLLPRRLHEVTFAMLLDLATQRDLARRGRELELERSIDVVHVVTPVSPRAPSLLRFRQARTIYGPLNGGMSYSPAFRHRDSWATQLVVIVGRFLSYGANLCCPGKRAADMLLVANERTRESLPASVRRVPCERFVENGIESAW
jgi:hypothetical protein